MNRQLLRIASFDIGKVNFAHYIENVNVSKILELEIIYKSLPKKFQRKTKGELTPDMKNILEGLYLSGTRVHTGVYDIREADNIDSFTVQTRKNLICHLDSFRNVFNNCDIFVIEQQYFKTWSGGRARKRSSPGTEANVDAIKIAECLMTWILCEYPLREVIYFGSQNKTQILGAPWNLSKIERKRWASVECRRLYEMRNDKTMMDLFSLEDSVYRKKLSNENKIQSFLKTYDSSNSEDGVDLAEKVVRKRQKLDDISDACLQLQAFKFKTMIACF
jgi:hypothetical protein